MYHFANYCINHDLPIPLEDGTSKIFLNTATECPRDLDLDLQLFYDYVRGKPAQTTFTKELDSSIPRLKEEKEERNMYLTYTSRMMECRQDGYQEGISIGLERGAYQNKLETARSFLSMGLAPQTVAQGTGLPLEIVKHLGSEPLELGSEE